MTRNPELAGIAMSGHPLGGGVRGDQPCPVGRGGGVEVDPRFGAALVAGQAEVVISRTRESARCLSGSGRIRVRFSRVSQDRALRTWSRYSPAAWTRP